MEYRAALHTLKPYSVEEDDWSIKLDANESPYNVPPLVRERIMNRLDYLAFNRYPEMGMQDLRTQIAGEFRLSMDNVLLGSGSSELLATLCYTFGGPGRGIVFPVPSFSMYAIYAQISDSVSVPVELNEDYTFPKEKMLQAAKENNGKLIIICNPNNPTGTVTSLDDIEYVVSRAECPVVVDEAYYEFHGESAVHLLGKYKNLIVARTFSKAYALAAARVGYMMADCSLTALIAKAQMPYHVNALSLAAAEVVYQMKDEFMPLIRQIIEERNRLAVTLTAMDGITVFPSSANFLLIKTEKAAEIGAYLRGKAVAVRDFSKAPYLENCIRITVGSPQENELLVKYIADCI